MTRPTLAIVVSLLASAAALAAGAVPAYSVRALGGASDILGVSGLFYDPTDEIGGVARPPPLVVMWGGFAQPASATHGYAHVFASSGLAVLALDDALAAEPSGGGHKAPTLSRASRRRAEAEAVRRLAGEGAVDAARVAYWGVEHGAAAALEAALAAPEGQAQIIVLQTPWLGAARAHAWRHLTARGWAHAAKALAVATADAAAALLGLPAVAAVPLAGPAGSGALLELPPAELAAHRAAAAARLSTLEARAAKDAAAALPAGSVRAAALLELLFTGDPVRRLLPELPTHLAFYAATGDEDASGADYTRTSKLGRYVSFHAVRAGRYGLLAAGLGVAGSERAGGRGGGGGAGGGGQPVASPDREAFEDAVLDQALMLAALLGRRDDGDAGGPVEPDGERDAAAPPLSGAGEGGAEPPGGQAAAGQVEEAAPEAAAAGAGEDAPELVAGPPGACQTDDTGGSCPNQEASEARGTIQFHLQVVSRRVQLALQSL
ncbi:hypothetical protein MNEG_9893 [Monoraphidium neglectum]|uniref:Uncharacterized protein n=1 Tax=Monoraphidium neglectum TaxID=145388 RepID=A0A0D2MUH5_9CHLO|nr:hypothetical protein MNEG_9893 [Monoraphidium neglectum]KIY98070.1 hypothetical protein MNEG_9893 [Monoraphidium neglectum]|eukprot:XP_013897090.1 hypothetical protein MNEG_9893 [Monoraphidium neglectum]